MKIQRERNERVEVIKMRQIQNIMMMTMQLKKEKMIKKMRV